MVSLGNAGGGSTITQQVVKNVLLTHERSVTRKAVEIVLAIVSSAPSPLLAAPAEGDERNPAVILLQVLETQLRKPQVLEQYLNRVYWGHGAYGISAASATYFGKKPGQLNASEAALLASLLPAPELFSPFRKPELADRMRVQVLRTMQKCGYLNKEDADRWIAEGLPASLTARTQPSRQGPFPGRPWAGAMF